MSGASARSTEAQVVGALGSIGLATLASRVLGFVRDVLVALAFGAGPVTDAFFVAFRIPNVLRRLLAEGALSTAVIPVISDYAVNRSRPDLVRMLRAVLAAALAVLTGATALGVLGAPWIVRVFAPGFGAEPEQAALTTLLTRVMFPYLILVGLGVLATGILNAHGRFFAAALGPALLNVGMIAAILLLAPRVEPPILALAIGVLVGGALQLLVQLPDLRRCGLLVGPSRQLGHPALGRVARLLLPAVFGLAAVQVTVFVNTLLASLLRPGSISFLYYADRIMEFPLGVFGIALASAALPAMSRQAAAGDRAAVAGTVTFALRLAAYITVPATVGLIALRTPIVRVLFERREFGPAETAATAAALAWYAAGLAAFAAARIAAQAFYALGEPGTAVRLGVLSVGANVVVAVGLMWLVDDAHPMKHAGLAAASSAGAYVNVVALLVAARRRLGALGLGALARSVGRTVAAAVPVAVWCVLAVQLWPAEPRPALDAAWLAATIAGGAGLFWAASAALGAPERVELARMLPSRRSG